jgi:hypothetical protein
MIEEKFGNFSRVYVPKFTIFMPAKNDSNISGVVMYFHPTIFEAYNAPT